MLGSRRARLCTFSMKISLGGASAQDSGSLALVTLRLKQVFVGSATLYGGRADSASELLIEKQARASVFPR